MISTLGVVGGAAVATFPVGGSSDPFILGTVLFLDGKDLIDRFQAKSLEFSDAIGEGDTLEFMHQVLAGGVHLKVGQQVVLRQDTVNIFRGTINGIEEVEVPGSDALFTRVEAVDLTKILEHRLVTAAEAYTNQTAGFIAKDLITKYLTNDGVTTNSVQDGPTLSAFSIKAFTKVSKALKDLGDRTAFIMFVDAIGDLHFEAQTAKLAPFAVGSFGNTGGALLDSGTAQAGSSNTLTLRAAAPPSLPVDSVLSLPSGPGSVQERPVSAYDGGTKVATVSPRWRTNVFTRSEEFNNVNWVKTSVSVVANQAVAPDGTVTADLIKNTDAGGVTFHYARQIKSLAQNQTYTLSVFAKYVAGSGIVWLLGNASGDIFCYFNVQTGVVTQSTGFVSASVEDLGNGTYRLVATFTNTAATGNQEIGYGVCEVTGTPSFNSTGKADQEQVYFWGAQLEQASALGDYIKTEAAAITLPDATTGYEVREPNEIPLDDVSVNQTREKYRNRQTIRYGSDLSLSVTRDDLTEQSARRAVEGTSGIYHAVQDEREITTAGEATDLADALLRRFKISTTLRFSIRRRGLKAGQSITLTFPEYGVSGTHLIDKVSARDDGTDQLMWDVTTLSGEHLGDVMEFWRNMFDSEQ